MRKLLVDSTFVPLVACVLVTAARAQPSAFEAPADLFYLHPLVNYGLPLDWQADFEREVYARGGLQTSAGSISTRDLATAVRVEVVEAVHDHLRFRYRLDWDESPHVDGGERQNWLGLEVAGPRTTYGRFGVEVLVNPTSDKAQLDLMPGLVWSDAERTRYVRLAWRRDDSLFGEKNDRGGVQTHAPSGPAWDLRLAHGAWEFVGRGTALGRLARRFDDPLRSPDLQTFEQRRSWSSHALRWSTERRTIELRFEHRDFDSRERPRDDGPVLRQTSRWRHVRAAWQESLGPRWRLRVQLHRLHYDNAFESTDHERRETLAGVFVAHAVTRGHWIDLGWMATDYAWASVPETSVYGSDEDGVASKLSIGWTYEIDERARLRAMLSHEPDPQDFGGAGLQAQMLF